MTRARIVGTLAACLAGGGALLALEYLGGSQDGANTSSGRARVTHPEAAASPRGDVAAVRGSPRVEGETAVTPALVPLAVEARESIEALPSAAELEERVTRRNLAIDSLFASQGSDPPWATRTETDLREVAGREVFAGSAFSEITCRETLCRVQVENVDAQEAANFRTVFPPQVQSLPSGTMRLDDSGPQPRTTVFFARASDVLPRLDDF